MALRRRQDEGKITVDMEMAENLRFLRTRVMQLEAETHRLQDNHRMYALSQAVILGPGIDTTRVAEDFYSFLTKVAE